VPKRLLSASLESSLATPSVVKAREYVATDLHDGRALLLCGPTGVGKSWALAAILAALPAWPRRFCYFPALASALLDQATRRDALESVRRTRIVALDDLGSEYLKPGGLLEATIDDIVWHREAEELPTIISTNLKPDELRERLSPRIIDRLAEWAVIVPVPGNSLRGRDRRPSERTAR
jgi:DNA replication protein DnaC